MTLSQLIDELALRTGFSDSRYRPRWIAFINDAVREFARTRPWEGLEDTVRLKTDGTKYLILPQYVDTVVSILDIEGNRPVERAGDFDVHSPSAWAQGTVGPPYQYDRAGDVPALRDPAGYLWFQSTHSSDLLPLYVTGIVANSGGSGALESSYRELSISATGTSPVTLSLLFTKIFSISKATDTNGDFFIYDAGATNAHTSYVGRFEPAAKFHRLAFLYKPAAGRSLEVRFRYHIPKITNDAQAPHPSVKADFVIQYAMSLHQQEQEQFGRQQVTEQKAQRVIEKEANKDENFNEPHARFIPQSPRGYDDAYDSYYW